MSSSEVHHFGFNIEGKVSKTVGLYSSHPFIIMTQFKYSWPISLTGSSEKKITFKGREFVFGSSQIAAFSPRQYLRIIIPRCLLCIISIALYPSLWWGGRKKILTVCGSLVILWRWVCGIWVCGIWVCGIWVCGLNLWLEFVAWICDLNWWLEYVA